jgi:hypothetical protein
VVCGSLLFVLSVDAQAGLEPAAVVATVRNGAKFDQCSLVGGGFPQARGSECRKFNSG